VVGASNVNSTKFREVALISLLMDKDSIGIGIDTNEGELTTLEGMLSTSGFEEAIVKTKPNQTRSEIAKKNQV